MAVINLCTDFLNNEYETKNIAEGILLKDYVKDYITNNVPDGYLKEVYYPQTDETKMELIESEGYGVTVIVNGEEKDLNYITNADDVIIVIITPKDGAGGGWSTAGGILTTVGMAMVKYTPGWFKLAGGIIATIGTIFQIVGGVKAYKASEVTGSSEGGLDNTALLSINGANNQPIVNQRYPMIFGEHLTTPLIVGSGWHETYTGFEVPDPSDEDKKYHKDVCKDNGQFYHVLYCVGYGPLKITDIKLQNTILAYNRSRLPGDSKRTIMHGMLKGWNDADTGDILKKWKNNDVELEILQAGNFESHDGRWGTIYNKTVKEDELDNANILFAHDKSIADNDKDSVSYKGVSVPCGYRTNTVRFSGSCPYKIQVELDLPNGLFSSRVKTKDKNSNAEYNDIPLNIAVQWRYAKAGEVPSDAESPDGWNNFDNCVFTNISEDGVRTEQLIKPEVYTAADRDSEIELNLGLSEGTSADYNDKWLNSSVFKLNGGVSGVRHMNCTPTEIQEAIENGYIEPVDITYVEPGTLEIEEGPFHKEYNSSATISGFNVTQQGIVNGYSGIQEIIPHSVEKTIFSGPYLVGTPTKTEDNEVIIGVSMEKDSGDFNSSYKKDSFNINERRYVFEKTFTEEECRKLIDLDNAKSEYLDSIEVRVIRLTPCYIDQTNNSNSDTYSNMSYQDLVKWTYLRTWCFDKKMYTEAVNKATRTNTLSDIRVIDYPLRPIPEEDLNRFCYIALKIKQDVAETGGSSLNQLNCIATNLVPKYSTLKHWWMGLNSSGSNIINELYNYYYYDRNEYGIKRINKLPLAYNDSRVANFYCWSNQGNIIYVKNMTVSVGDEYYIDIEASPAGTIATKVNLYAWQSAGNLYIYTLTDNPVSGDSVYDIGGSQIGTIHSKTGNVIIVSGESYNRTSGDTYYITIGNTKYKRDYDGDLGDTELFNIGITPEMTGEEQYLIGSSNPEYKEHFYKKRIGTDFVDIIRNNIFRSGNFRGATISKDLSVISTFVLSLEDQHRYITSNSASQSLMALLGPHLKEDSKTWNDVNDTMFGEFFEFCNDVTDGTQEEYKIQDEYNITANLTDSRRAVTGQALLNKGWTGISANYYAVYFPKVYTYKNDGTYSESDFDYAIIATPIANDGSILTPTELKTQVDTIASTGTKTNIYLGKIIGKDSLSLGNAYSYALENLGKLYFDQKSEHRASGVREHLFAMSDKPVNALVDGVYDEFIEEIELEFLHTDASYAPYYKIALQQMSLPSSSYKVFAAADGLAHIQFNANGVVSSEIKMDTLFMQLLITGRACYRRGEFNKYEPVVGMKNPYPVTVLNQRNVYSKNNVRNFQETVAGYHALFIDKDDNYTKNDLYIMDDGEDYRNPTRRIDQINIPFITERRQLWSIGRYNLACALYQKESYTRTVGMIGYTLNMGDVVLLQDDSLLVGTDNSGRIQELIEDENYIYGFTIDDAYNYTGELDSNNLCKKGCTIVQPDKFQASRCVTIRMATLSGIETAGGIRLAPVVGITNKVIFEHAINKNSEISEDSSIDGDFYTYSPKVGDLVAFGDIGKITIKAIIMSIQPQDNDKFQLNLVPYNEDLYNAGITIPEFNANITVPSRDETLFNFREYASTSERNEAFADIINLKEAAEDSIVPDNVSYISAKAKRDGIELISQIPLISKTAVKYIKYQICRDYDSTQTSHNWITITTDNTAATESFYYFDREASIDGYPERTANALYPDARDLSKYRIRAKCVSFSGLESEEWSQAYPIDTTLYGTWIPPKLDRSYIDCVVGEDGITVVEKFPLLPEERTATNEGYYGQPYEKEYQFTVDGSLYKPFSAEYNKYIFDRNIEKYPEKPSDDPDDFGSQAYIESLYNYEDTNVLTDGNGNIFTSRPVYFGNAKVKGRFKSTIRTGEFSENKDLNWDSYLTWIPSFNPNYCKAVVDKRYVTFTGNQPENKPVYTGVKYGVLITKKAQSGIESTVLPYDRKSTNPDLYNWYNTFVLGNEDVRADEDSYKREYPEDIPEPIEVSTQTFDQNTVIKNWVNGSFMHELPLIGQNFTMYRLDSYMYVVADENPSDPEVAKKRPLTSYIKLDEIDNFKNPYNSAEYVVPTYISEPTDKQNPSIYNGADTQYEEADPQPTGTAQIGDPAYYYISGDEYVKVQAGEQYDSSVIYYTRVSSYYYFKLALVNMPMPLPTEYKYKIIVRNSITGYTKLFDESDFSNEISFKVFTNSVEDLTDGAITQNKLADGAVTADKIAAGTISAEQLVAGDILTKGARAGMVSAEGITVDDAGFWASKPFIYSYLLPGDTDARTYTTEKGEFFIGEDPTGDLEDADYFHYKPSTRSFDFQISSFRIRGIHSIVNGVFLTKSSEKSGGALVDPEGHPFFVINPNDTADTNSDSGGTATNTAARTIRIGRKGDTGYTDRLATVILNGEQRITGNLSVGGTLEVTGAATLKSTLDVTGATTLKSTLSVTGATTLSSTLGVTGATTLSSTLSVTNAATLKSTLGVTGATTLSSTLEVTGATTLKSTLTVAGLISANGGISISGSLSGVSDITASGTLNLTNTNDSEASRPPSCALVIGPKTGQHLEFDNNEIMSKATGTTTGTLYIQGNGGDTSFGGGVSATTLSASTVIASGYLRIPIGHSSSTYTNGEIWIG